MACLATWGSSVAIRRVNVAILAIAGFFLVALAGFGLAFVEQQREVALRRAETGTRDLARLLEQYARRAFETADLVTAQVAEQVAAAGGAAAVRDDRRQHETLRALSERITGDYVTVVDDAGHPSLMTATFPAPPADFSDRRWFIAHRDGADRHVGEAIASRLTGEVLFTFTRALRRPDGTLDGVVQVAQRPRFFQDQAQASEVGSGVALAMFDNAGRILARTGITPAMLGLGIANTPMMRDFATKATGTYRMVSRFDGLERIVSFRRLADWPVIVTASVPVASALAPFRATLTWAAAAVSVVVLGLALLTILALRLAAGEKRALGGLAGANAALREAASGLEARVEERTRALAAARDALAASEQRFRAIFDSTFQFIGLLTPDGILLEANRTALAFAGVTREEVVGRPLWETHWFATGPDAEARLRAAVAAAAAGTPQRYEEVARGRDRLASIDFSLRPLHDDAGRVVLLVPEGHDLTDLKAAEAQLRESQKMEALGQLTGGVAHDFNNLLMAVLGNLALLKKRLPEEPRLHRLVDGALQGAERGAALTQRLLAFARRQELRPAPVDLAGLVQGMRGLLERSIGPGIELAAALPAGLPPSLVDANQLELALLNLAVNARNAMPGGGTITVTLAEATAPDTESPPGLAAGHYLRLGLRDTGSGMAAATLARATEPFFTTKGPHRGSGLGLSMVQGLAQQSGGGLRLVSQPGAGTLAEIWLPRAIRAAEPPSCPPAPAALPPQPRRHVLVVDDDALVAAGTAMLLEDLGHRATIALSAAEALTQLAAQPDIDLVLTDFAMPGTSGLDLAERLRAERPTLPVALATGYADLPGAATTWLPRVNKPYSQQDLAALVARLTPASPPAG